MPKNTLGRRGQGPRRAPSSTARPPSGSTAAGAPSDTGPASGVDATLGAGAANPAESAAPGVEAADTTPTPDDDDRVPALAPPERNATARYPGLVLAAVCVVGLAVVFGGRQLLGSSSEEAAQRLPAANGAPLVVPGPGRTGATAPEAPALLPRATGAPTAGPSARVSASATPSAATRPAATRSAATGSAADPTTPGPLAAVVSPVGRPAATVAAAAGQELVGNARITATDQARSSLSIGAVDLRLATVLATVARQAPISVLSFSSATGDPGNASLRQVLLTPTNPADAATVAAALANQRAEFAVTTVQTTAVGSLVQLDTAGSP